MYPQLLIIAGIVQTSGIKVPHNDSRLSFATFKNFLSISLKFAPPLKQVEFSTKFFVENLSRFSQSSGDNPWKLLEFLFLLLNDSHNSFRMHHASCICRGRRT